MITTRMAAPALLAASALTNVALAQQPGLTRNDLQRHDLSTPGREAIQTIVSIAQGVTAPRHSHPGEEVIYVLEGVLEYQLDGQPPVTLKAGDVLFIRPESSTRRRLSAAATGRNSPRLSSKKASRSSCWPSEPIRETLQ